MWKFHNSTFSGLRSRPWFDITQPDILTAVTQRGIPCGCATTFAVGSNVICHETTFGLLILRLVAFVKVHRGNLGIPIVLGGRRG